MPVDGAQAMRALAWQPESRPYTPHGGWLTLAHDDTLTTVHI